MGYLFLVHTYLTKIKMLSCKFNQPRGSTKTSWCFSLLLQDHQHMEQMVTISRVIYDCSKTHKEFIIFTELLKHKEKILILSVRHLNKCQPMPHGPVTDTQNVVKRSSFVTNVIIKIINSRIFNKQTIYRIVSRINKINQGWWSPQKQLTPLCLMSRGRDCGEHRSFSHMDRHPQMCASRREAGVTQTSPVQT